MSKRTFLSILVVFVIVLAIGCGKKETGVESEVTVDETTPLDTIKQQIASLDLDHIRSAALKYKDAIGAKRKELDSIMDQFKKLPIADKMGQEATDFMAEIEVVNKSVAALTERFKLYYDEIKKKGGELKGLEL